MSKPASPLAQARQNAGMSIDDAVFEIRTALPAPFRTSRSGISRLEHKDPSTYDSGDLLVLGVLADAYGLTVAQLSPAAADQLDDLRSLVDGFRNRCSSTVLASV
jgi:hypothetical protein